MSGPINEPIVTFADPPIGETVLSVGFDPIEGMTSAHVGHFQHRYLSEYSSIDEGPEYVMPIEQFSESVPNLRISIDQRTAPTRTALISASGSEIVQVQRDWFAYNWRRQSGAKYPRYTANREAFESTWTSFADFAETAFGVSVKPHQAEVTYVNEIQAGVELSYSNLFTMLNQVNLGEGAESFDNVAVKGSSLIKGQGEPIGRLHVALSPSRDRFSGQPIYLLNLTARGPVEGDFSSILSFMDIARRSIVEGFKALTTPESHERWNLL